MNAKVRALLRRSLPRARRRHQLAEAMLRALNEGLTVEDILMALGAAIEKRWFQASSAEPDMVYRQELQFFYVSAANVLRSAISQVEQAGEAAKAAAQAMVRRSR